MQLRTSYKLETLQGTPLPGEFSARRLRAFIPREGTQLYHDQQKHMRELRERAGEEATAVEEEEDGPEGDEDNAEVQEAENGEPDALHLRKGKADEHIGDVADPP